MLKKILGLLEEIVHKCAFALVGPTIISLLYQVMNLFSYGVAMVIASIVGFFFIILSFGFTFGGDTADDRILGGSYLVWAFSTAFSWPAAFSLSRTTLLASAIVYGAALLWWLSEYIPMKLGQRRSILTEAEENAKKAKRDALVERINRLIGDSAQTTALLAAIERLTQYVPEVSERLLSAVADDAERFVMLRGLESTTVNEVLRYKCKVEADEIAESARKLCADSTEMALELLAEYQGIEADSTLGDERGSRLAQAHEEFKYYLKGLKEVRPYTDDGVSREIRELAAESPTRALPGQGKARRIKDKH